MEENHLVSSGCAAPCAEFNRQNLVQQLKFRYREKSMRALRSFAVAFIAGAAITGCGKPVPPEKASYVGEWQQPTMYLLITQDGSVRYRRLKGGVTTSVDGPLQEFHGDSFDVGIGPMSTTFVVSKPPYQQEGSWKMTVDGVELTRTSTLQ